MDMSKYLDLFVSEATEHIQAAGNEAARLASGGSTAETINALFRHFHSIKGMAASMGYAPIADLSHAVEDLFDGLRKGAGRPSPAIPELVTEALDAVTAMVSEAATHGSGVPLSGDAAPLIAKIRALAPTSVRQGRAPAPAEPSPASTSRLFRCLVGIDPRAEFPGARAALVLQRLERVGRIVSITPSREAMMKPEFEGEIVVRLAADGPEAALLDAVKDVLDVQRFELREEGAAEASQRGSVPAGERRGADGLCSDAPAEGQVTPTLRIPTAALDLFLDAIAGLIAQRGVLGEAIKAKDPAGARWALGKISDAVDALRDQVMLLRLQPFEHISPRLSLTVRDLCRKTDKRVSLAITGAEVALDRAVLEHLIDPLNHLLRNAVDHGIALPSRREAAGKPAQGTIRIGVTRRGDQVTVVVEDDGEGMDVEAIRRTARAGGFASAADLAAMDDQQVLMLTTIPGFSTARAVTDISGRGVGMDVVRTRIEALHGHMRIHSRRGEGTRIELSVPLTVALIDAFLVDSAAGVFAVPAGAVSGVQIVDPGRVRATVSGSFVASKDEAGAGFIPLVRLEEALRVSAPREAAGGRRDEEPLHALTFQIDGTRGALAVRRILERRELVVKPLGPPLEHLREYSGAALLEDGGVALVLDLVNLAGAA